MREAPDDWLHRLTRRSPGGILLGWTPAAIGVLGLLWLGGTSPVAPAANTPAPVIEAGITTTYTLPEGMYGQWSVQGTLIETENGQLFPGYVNDLWLIEQIGSQVRLSNPATGASAAIQVQAVEGNRAHFQHVSSNGPTTYIERPDIQVQGDQLFGETRIERVITVFGQTRRASARYRLQATRLNQSPGTRLDISGSPQSYAGRFAPGRTPPPPTFDIAPIQREGSKPTTAPSAQKPISRPTALPPL